MLLLKQAACPGCGETLRLPAEFGPKVMRCRFCGQLLRARKALPVPLAGGAQPNGPAQPELLSLDADDGPAPAASPSQQGADAPRAPADVPHALPMEELNPYLAQLRQRRKRRTRIKLAVTLVLLVSLGGAGFLWRNELWTSGEELLARMGLTKAAPEADKPDPSIDKLIVKNDAPEEAVKPKPNPQDLEFKFKRNQLSKQLGGEPEPEPDTIPDTKVIIKPKPAAVVAPRASGRYPRRALLVGVRNYIYASPLNPGYRNEGLKEGENDPLGLGGLRQVLWGLQFGKTQVGELSDVAGTDAHPPLQGTMKETIAHFLENSRPQDRIVLAFVGHCVEIDGKGQLVPLEAELDKAPQMISIEWLYEQLGKCPARQKVLILDAAHLDPEQGNARKGGEPLSAKVEKQLEEDRPKGVQVWLSCSAGQNSHEFASSGLSGSAFMHYLVHVGRELIQPRDRRELEKRLGLPEGTLAGGPADTLPLTLVASEVNRDVAAYVKERWGGQQTPRLLGKETDGPDPGPNDPTPAPVAIQVPKGTDKLADAKLVAGIIKEMGVKDALPPFFAKPLEPYVPDYADQEEFLSKLAEHPLRKAVYEAADFLNKPEVNRSFPMTFRYPGEEANFKKQLLNQQEMAAETMALIFERLTNLEELADARKKEPAKRWQAHYDYVYAQLLAKAAKTQEWNFTLGQMRKETPERKNKESTGWNLVPQAKLLQKETRDMEKKRQAALERLINEHPGTPWELLARRDKDTLIGLQVQEAKVP